MFGTSIADTIVKVVSIIGTNSSIVVANIGVIVC